MTRSSEPLSFFEILATTLLLASFTATPTSASGGPVLAFSDLTSGPNSGNSDTSKGQAAGTNGAIISVWGLNLGSSQGNSEITLNGAPASVIYYWGDAVPPWSPANLHNGYQNMQVIIFQIPSVAALGAGNIQVSVGGQISNPLPFTVDTGRFFFVSNSGADSNAGTYQSPKKTIVAAKNAANLPGDIVYVEDGVNALTDQENVGFAVRMPYDGTAAQPIALVAYPGATSQIGTTGTPGTANSGLEAFNFSHTGNGPDTQYITVSKFNIRGGCCPLGMKEGSRLVGGTVSAPNGDIDAGVSGSRGSNIYWIGNEWMNSGIQGGNSQYLYHVIYSSGRRQQTPIVPEIGRYIEWNYFHDNNATRAINAYNYDDAGTGLYDPIEGHHIDHNVIINQHGDGIGLLAEVSGENWVYDNLVINSGLGPDTAGNGTQHSCMDIRAGYTGIITTIRIYNNTCYNSGCPNGCGTNPDTGVFNFKGTSGYTLDVHNNIAFQTVSTIPYLNSGSDVPTINPVAWSNNLWFGAGLAPTFDSNSLNADPKFVSAGSNFCLASGSPAIGNGSNLGGAFVTSDLDGTPQPPTPDLGPYEHTIPTTMTQAPAIPTGLRFWP